MMNRNRGRFGGRARGRRGGRASRQGRPRNQENSNVTDREEKSSPSFASLPLVIPKKYWNKMVWVDDTFERSSTTSWKYWNLHGNGMYDVDGGAFTSSVRDFSTMAELYNYYIVDSVMIEWTVGNLTDGVMNLYVACTDTDYSLQITSRNTAAQIGELPFAIMKSISAKGGNDRVTIKTVFDFPKIEGSRARYYGEDSNYGGSNTNPLYLRYIHFGQACTSNMAAATGISSNLRLTFKVLWSDRKYDLAITRIGDKKINQDEEKILDEEMSEK